MRRHLGFMGLGKLGLPVALALDNLNYEVLGFDVDLKIKDILETRELPYREVHADKYLKTHHITFCSVSELIESCDIIFVPIQTPHDPKFEGIDLLSEERKDFTYTYLKNGIVTLCKEAEYQEKEVLLVVISTVLPGTIEREIKPLLNNYTKFCYNPFFIAMGTTIDDFLNPEFILIGADDNTIAEELASFYREFNTAPIMKTAINNAELIKVAYNCYIGMKIVYANTMMEICHKTGCDVDEIIRGISLANKRLMSPKYLSGGMGDGGGCHNRDNIAMSWLARKLDLSHDFFEDIMYAREDQTRWLVELILDHDLPVFILGKAFKPETNLTVGSPAILLKNLLANEQVFCQMYDPYIDGKFEVTSPHVFFIATKHEQFKDYTFPVGSVIIDPWRYIPDKPGCKVIRIGQARD